MYTKFIEFKNLTETQTGRKFKVLHTDNGTEYCNQHMLEITTNAGIVHQKSAPYTPEHNGIAERMNHTLIEKARGSLLQSNLGKKYWAEAVHTSLYLTNRMPSRGLKNKTPEHQNHL